MYLSYLVYRCAKEAANYGAPDFNYEHFLSGESAEDEDYSAFIDKALPVVNEFIQRCYELNKLPAKVVNLGAPNDGLLDLPDDFGKCIALFQYSYDGTDYMNIGFRRQNKKIVPLAPKNDSKDYYLQYRAKVPYFMESDYPNHVFFGDVEINGEIKNGLSFKGNFETIEEMRDAVDEDGKPNDIDLEETYGFSDTLASICIAFVQGRLMDDRSEGHSREMEAESRLADVTLDETLFLQKSIVRKFR